MWLLIIFFPQIEYLFYLFSDVFPWKFLIIIVLKVWFYICIYGDSFQVSLRFKFLSLSLSLSLSQLVDFLLVLAL